MDPIERNIWRVVDEFMRTRRDAAWLQIDRWHAVLGRAFVGMHVTTLADLDADSADAYLDTLGDPDDGNLAPSTVDKHRVKLKALSRWSHRKGWLPRDVFAELASRKGLPRRIRQVFTEDQLRRFFSAADAGPEWQGLTVRLAYYQGLRGREVTGLRWGDIDFERVRVILAADRQKAKKHSIIPLMPHVCALLQARRAAFEAEGTATGVADLVFPGIPPSTNARFSRHHKKAVEAAGIVYMDRLKHVADFHALRHTCLTDMGNAGTPLHVLQDFARHSSPETTKAYVRVNDDIVRKGQEALHVFTTEAA